MREKEGQRKQKQKSGKTGLREPGMEGEETQFPDREGRKGPEGLFGNAEKWGGGGGKGLC